MKANLVKIQKQRHFSEEFKREIVGDFERGKFTVKELGKLYQVKDAVIYRWIYKYSNFNHKSIQIVEMKESSTQKLKELEKKIKELERAVGQKQLHIDYLEKMIDIAKDELGVDIKKNSNTPQLVGSDQIRKK